MVIPIPSRRAHSPSPQGGDNRKWENQTFCFIMLLACTEARGELARPISAALPKHHSYVGNYSSGFWQFRIWI